MMTADYSPYCQLPIAEESKGIHVRLARCRQYPARDSVRQVGTKKSFSGVSGAGKPLGLILVEEKALFWAEGTSEHPRKRVDDTPFEMGCVSCRTDMVAGTVVFGYGPG